MTSSAPESDATGSRRDDVHVVVHREALEQARSSGLLVGAIAAVGYPAWAVLDIVLEPAIAGSLVPVRAVGTVLIWCALALLWRHPAGRLQPGALIFTGLAVVQLTTAWMLAVVDHVEFYLLGLSLALHGSGVLLSVGLGWTVALISTTWTALALAVAADPSQLSGRTTAAVVVYLGLTSLVALLAHWRRARLAAAQLATRVRLDAEQRRTHQLLVRLERLSHEDPLTGLANRRRWDDELAAGCTRARESGERLAVVLLDVDHFKHVNDQFGHAAGDAALQAVAGLLLSRVRAGDLVARLGGDELALLLPGAGLVDAVRLAERVRAEAHDLWPEGFADPGVSLSLGVAAAVGAGADPRGLLASADAQLYRAKTSRDAVRAARTALV
ncbi:diguanylate cyclase [Modestobacter sp. SYSU DS0511]